TTLFRSVLRRGCALQQKQVNDAALIGAAPKVLDGLDFFKGERFVGHVQLFLASSLSSVRPLVRRLAHACRSKRNVSAFWMHVCPRKGRWGSVCGCVTTSRAQPSCSVRGSAGWRAMGIILLKQARQILPDSATLDRKS